MRKHKKELVVVLLLVITAISSWIITPIIIERRIDDYIAKQGIKEEDIIVKKKLGLSLNLLEYKKIISLKDNPDIELRYSYLIYDPPIFLIPDKYEEFYKGVYYNIGGGNHLEEGQKYFEGTLGKDGKFLREFETINIK